MTRLAIEILVNLGKIIIITTILIEPKREIDRARARSREHNNTMQKLILNYMRLHEHTHLRKYAYLYEDMRTKKWTNVL